MSFKLKQWLRKIIVFGWVAFMAALAYWIGTTAFGFIGSYLLVIPCVVLFLLVAFLPGKPYAVRPPGLRYVFRLQVIPQEERTTFFRSWWPVRIVRVSRLKQRVTVIRTVLLTVGCLAVFGTGSLPYVRQRMQEGTKKDIGALVHYDPVVTTRVYAATGEQICAFHQDENRIVVPLEELPPHVKQAFLAAEDSNFYEHGALSPLSMARAATVNFKSGATKQGASTITQQAVKMVILGDYTRSVSRKVQEMYFAVEVEKYVSKDDIFKAYINEVNLGHHSRGVEVAAQNYFSKHAKQLTIGEAAMLAGLPRAPSSDSPYAYYDRARTRQKYVLGQMAANGFITQAQADAAWKEDVPIVYKEDALNLTAAPYFCRLVYNELKRMYGTDMIFKRGLTVRTTLDLPKQRAAENAVRDGLLDLERRIGFEGPEGAPNAVALQGCAGPAEDVGDGTRGAASVTGVAGGITLCLKGKEYPLHAEDLARVAKWSAASGKKLAVGDLVTVKVITDAKDGKRYAITSQRTGGAQHPEALQASLIVTDPHTGELVVYVPGYDFNENQWDNATMALRQPGSSIKPIVYLTGLRYGMSPDLVMIDGPRCYDSASGIWCPQNYKSALGGRQYWGAVNLRTALAQSLNSISVQIAAKYGIENVIDTARLLGYTAPLPRVLPLAVGAAEVTVWEHAMGYTSIAANGKVLPRQPGASRAGIFIKEVQNGLGKVLYKYEPKPRSEWPQAVPAAAAAATLYLMKNVVETGTGKRLKELGWPAAAKTGTTNNFQDVWFCGSTDAMSFCLWVGRQTPTPITKEATGGSIALPIALAALKQIHPQGPAREFELPDDVVLMRDPKGGDLIPYPRDNLPEHVLSGTASTVFDGPSPFSATEE